MGDGVNVDVDVAVVVGIDVGNIIELGSNCWCNDANGVSDESCLLAKFVSLFIMVSAVGILDDSGSEAELALTFANIVCCGCACSCICCQYGCCVCGEGVGDIKGLCCCCSSRQVCCICF